MFPCGERCADRRNAAGGSYFPRKCPLFHLVRRRADSPQTFRVSDAVRRRKVVGARTRGVGVTTYGDFDFRPVRAMAWVHAQADGSISGRLLLGAQCGRPDADRPILGELESEFGGAESAFGRGRCRLARSPERGCSEACPVEPCGVMASVSRSRLVRRAAHAAGSGAAGSQ